MTGFPNRPARVAFGPTMENVRPVTNPVKELDADQMNLSFWQVAGAGRVLPLAVFVYDGATEQLTLQALAFDPRSELDDVPFVKNATGDYTLTFASTYKDEVGTNVAFVPRAAMAYVQGGDPQDQAVPTIDGQTVNLKVADGTDAAIDRVLLVLVW